jgi:hypothetical protein
MLPCLVKMRFLLFLTPSARFFPKSQRHCAAQHPRGELVNDAGTFTSPTFCHVSDFLACGNAFSVVFDALRPIFSEVTTPLRGETPARRTRE